MSVANWREHLPQRNLQKVGKVCVEVTSLTTWGRLYKNVIKVNYS
jgi:hypothetical protein